MANTTCIIISPVITRVSLKKDQRMCQSEQVHACHHVCMHHITEFFLYLQQKQMMQQVLEKARLALELHEVVKAMRGWILYI